MARRSRLGKITSLRTTRDPASVTLDLDGAEPGERAVASIAPRAGVDTRGLAASHVVALAESIGALGLLEPIVVDGCDRLLAGGHRLAACRILAAPRSTRAGVAQTLLGEFPGALPSALASRVAGLEWADPEGFRAVPVRVVPFDSMLDLDRALAIEAAENAQRRDYRPDEVRALYERLLDAGFTDRTGRPSAGERRARPVIAAVIGRSDRQVRNILNRAEARKDTSPEAARRRLLARLGRAVDAVYTSDDPALDELRRALSKASVPAVLGRALER